jgi:hypothetical protein
MVKPTVHFFGDSFTEGVQLKNTPYIWPKLITAALKDYDYKNYAQGGASPQFIVNQVIKNLTGIKSGDKVFLLETIPDRIEVYSEYRDKVVSVTNSAIVNALSNTLPIDKEYFNDEQEIKSAFNFIYDHRYKRLGVFAKYFSNIYSDFGEYFKTTGVEFILLPYRLTFHNIPTGEMFETVTKQTKGATTDGHFSVSGHWQFASYILGKYYKEFNYELPLLRDKLLI